MSVVLRPATFRPICSWSLAPFVLAAACDSGSGGPDDPCALGPVVDRFVVGDVVLPGSRFEARGAGFGATCGEAFLYFRGVFEGRAVDFDVLAVVESSGVAGYTAGPELFVGLDGSAGTFDGEAGVRMRRTGRPPIEAGVPVSFRVVTELVPRLDSIAPENVTLNALVTASGDGFLSGAEGTTVAVLDGTFTPDAGTVRPVDGSRVEGALVEDLDRTRTAFPFAPTIAGIFPGTFDGTVTLENVHAEGTVTRSDPVAARFYLGESFVTTFRPATPTLGAIVTVEGAGFIGGAPDQTVTLRLDGVATPHRGSPTPVAGLEIVPAFVDGSRLAYTIIPVVADGALVAQDFGFARGVFSGSVAPVLRYGRDRREGPPTPIDVTLGPVKQVVLVLFLPGFVDALRLYGMRAVERHVRAAALDKFRRTYSGVGVDVREDWPADYYAGGYAVIEVGGPDPNGRGLFGYDNTPGKDVGNLRLHDRIGGANAEVQQDGYPGYGGVFIESMLCWSDHPPPHVVCPDVSGAAEFDRVFDPVREHEVVAGEYPDGPDAARSAVIAEAVRVLGNLIGDTLAHEFGHSLGLAHPYGPADLVHNEPPAEGCLMDAGAFRPFAERAELAGATPGGFCGNERAYLTTILPLD